MGESQSSLSQGGPQGSWGRGPQIFISLTISFVLLPRQWAAALGTPAKQSHRQQAPCIGFGAPAGRGQGRRQRTTSLSSWPPAWPFLSGK